MVTDRAERLQDVLVGRSGATAAELDHGTIDQTPAPRPDGRVGVVTVLGDENDVGGTVGLDDGQARTLTEIALHEVSPATGFPAYTATSASVRALAATAERAQVDVDELTLAIARLEAGEFLSREQVQMLGEVIDSLAVDDDMTEMPDDSSNGDVSVEVTVPLSLLQKQMDLAAKALGL